MRTPLGGRRYEMEYPDHHTVNPDEKKEREVKRKERERESPTTRESLVTKLIAVAKVFFQES